MVGLVVLAVLLNLVLLLSGFSEGPSSIEHGGHGFLRQVLGVHDHRDALLGHPLILKLAGYRLGVGLIIIVVKVHGLADVALVAASTVSSFHVVL